MIITILQTKTHAKFVVHKYPLTPILPSLKSPSSSEIIESTLNTFDYFGFYKQEEIISTTTGPLSHSAFVDMFSANQKYTQMCIGIDDNMVVTVKSTFIDQSYSNSFGLGVSSNVPMSSINNISDFPSSTIGSISIAYCSQDFSRTEDIKHVISYLLGVLQHKQNNSRYLTKQLFKIMEAKDQFKKKAKDLIYNYFKEQSTHSDIQIREFYNKLSQIGKKTVSHIDLFQLLKRFHISISQDNEIANPSNQFWPGSIKSGFNLPIIPPSKQIQQKTIITLTKKLHEQLPSYMYPQRVQRMVQTFSYTKNTVSKTLQTFPNLNEDSTYYTLNFLLANNLAIQAYPFQDKYYSLYCLRRFPTPDEIARFKRIFPQINLYKLLEKYVICQLAKQTQVVKYIILKGFLKEVKVYFKKLVESSRLKSKSYNLKNKQKQNTQLKQVEQLIQKNLIKYSHQNMQLNKIISIVKQPDFNLKNILQYYTNNKDMWVYYFVQE